MNKIKYIIIALLTFYIMPAKIHCQQNYEGIFLTPMYSTVKTFNMRADVKFSYYDKEVLVYTELGSFACYTDPGTKQFYMSANWVPGVLDYSLKKLFNLDLGILLYNSILNLFTNSQMYLLNSSFPVAVFVRQKTDFYIFYQDSRIYTESCAGAELVINNIRLTGTINFPWTSISMLEPNSKQLYFSLGVCIKLADDSKY